MRSAATRNILGFLAIILFAISGTAFGQGKGHGGGGNGGHGGGSPQKGGGPPPNAGRPQMQRPQPQMQRPQPQMQRPQPQFQRPQPQFQRPQPQPQFQRPQVMPGWQQMGKGQGKAKGRLEEARPQPQMQGWRIEQPRPQKARPEVRLQPQPQFDPKVWQKPGKGGGKNGYPALGLLGPPIQNRAWPNNYGYQRSTEVHLRNDERKALREQSRIAASYDRLNYRPSRVDVRRTDAWRDNILRSVVASAINTGVSYYSSPNYGYDYSYSQPYYPPSYNSGYYPASYSSGYYPDYQYYPVYQYPAYTGTVTYYNFYDPYDYSYSSYGYSDPNYTDYYADNIGLPGYYADDIGLPYLSGSSSLGGFVSRLFSELMAVGYNQGYQDALYTRTHSRRTSYLYEDPYDPYVLVQENVVEDVGYNPYSCIAANRRYVSEGYELGYRDALYGTTDYDPYYEGGNIDLVSALISATL
jgi:hypothetical protein